jgi:hypothetical protein
MLIPAGLQWSSRLIGRHPLKPPAYSPDDLVVADEIDFSRLEALGHEYKGEVGQRIVNGHRSSLVQNITVLPIQSIVNPRIYI